MSPRSKSSGSISFAARVPNWLGDAVLALPAVRALAECSRRGRLVALASSSSREIFSRVPGIVPLGIAKPGGSIVDSMRTALIGGSILRSARPVLVLSFTCSLTSALMCFLGRVPRRIGFDRGAGSRLYTDRVAWPELPREHLIDTYCRLVESIGVPVSSRVPSLDAAAEDVSQGEAVASGHGLAPGKFICLFPGARYGPSKRWPAARFALLGDAIIDKLGLGVVLMGAGEDLRTCDEVKSRMTKECTVLCGDLDFRGLVGLLRLAGGVVANDSGGMHLAAALGTPTVGLFFSTDPRWTGPVSPRSAVVCKRIGCSPCFMRRCGRAEECTESVSVDDALEALAGVMKA